ncbi:tRNA 2-thiocytidine biosynthesis protein TtcA [Methanobrevibacter cuticularis]|uniref:tRNA 2-thiocytidine biosynthesis protein TtcA n=1 Tax=Methanobrevibacter cuticularis TaxID=47311 RepID=A0A166FHZ8_9EURY|nr:TIGR00269 family protein [Methanobrevibacter cuticularis]KZX17693.1 tRNA 2-thiocytidine biosynthesis protein TtcA [Methanobrevibacter cuticularis]
MAILDKNKFNEKLFSRIEKLVNTYNLIEEGDLIAIALSGGKDSVLTLHALSKLQDNPDFHDFDIIAISVDEGITGYRQHGIDSAIFNAKNLGIELIKKSFSEEVDFTLDDVYSEFKSACIPCGVFRRTILNKTAYEIGADKIATGHNLDDEIQSFLMSFARADTLKFSKFGPKLDRIHPKLVPRIKPLWNTSEKDVGTWAVMNDINIHLDECPYSNLSLRAKTKNFLNQTESKNSGVKLNIMESFKEIFDIEVSKPVLNECERCGEPSSAIVCKACEIKDIIMCKDLTDS